MKRPLAVFGCVFLVSLLAAQGQRAGVITGAAALAAAAFFILVVRYKAFIKRYPYVPVVLVALAAALLYRTVYDALLVAPIQALAGQTLPAQFVVQQVQESNGSISLATVKVTALNGQSITPFKLTLWYPGEVTVGDTATASLRFYAVPAGNRSYYASKGLYISAAAANLAITGKSYGLLEIARLVQYTLSGNIRAKLPSRLAGISAAMAVGDRRYIPQQAVQSYRAAGISHLLVVSGLHLAVLSAAIQPLLKALVPLRRARSLLNLLFIVAIMAITGFTPSIVRCGIAFILVYAGELLWQQPDTYTSLGFAALLLCLQNPYAALDMGLLLSFTSTLAVLAGGQKIAVLKQQQQPTEPLPLQWATKLGFAALYSAVITLATLPVMFLFGGSVSLLAVPVNLITVPFLPILLVTGYCMAIPAGWPLLGLLARIAAFVNGVILVQLERLTNWCAGLTGAYMQVSGYFGLVLVLLQYTLVYLFYRYRYKSFMVTAALLLPCAMLLYNFLGTNLATVVVAGNSNPSLVVVQNGQAVVLYSGSNTLTAVQQVLQQQNATECVLMVDMRSTSQGTEYEAFAPAEVVRTQDIFYSGYYQPTTDISVWVRKQADGMVACVEVGGYRLALTRGSIDLTVYTAVDAVIAAGSTGIVQGDYAALLYGGTPPEWASPQAELYAIQSGTIIWIRPNQSIIFREVDSGTTNE